MEKNQTRKNKKHTIERGGQASKTANCFHFSPQRQQSKCNNNSVLQQAEAKSSRRQKTTPTEKKRKEKKIKQKTAQLSLKNKYKIYNQS